MIDYSEELAVKYYMIGWNGEMNKPMLFTTADGISGRIYGGQLPKGFIETSGGSQIGEYSKVFPSDRPAQLAHFENVVLLSSKHDLLPGDDSVIIQHPTPAKYLSR